MKDLPAFSDGYEMYLKSKEQRRLSTGIEALNEILGGGILHGVVHILFGAKKPILRILMDILTNALLPRSDDGLNFTNVVYVDGENRFDPYYITKKLSKQGYSANPILDRIFIARVFNWNQMVELLHEKLPTITADVLVLSGMTTMFEYSQEAFEDMKQMITGIKTFIMQNDPIVVIGVPLHVDSKIVPQGGKLVSHFGGIQVKVIDHARYINYSLEQHPFYPERSVRIWKRTKVGGKKLRSGRGKNQTLDSFL